MKRGKKQRKELERRIKDYERSGLSSKPAFRKPGSLKG